MLIESPTKTSENLEFLEEGREVLGEIERIESITPKKSEHDKNTQGSQKKLKLKPMSSLLAPPAPKVTLETQVVHTADNEEDENKDEDENMTDEEDEKEVPVSPPRAALHSITKQGQTYIPLPENSLRAGTSVQRPQNRLSSQAGGMYSGPQYNLSSQARDIYSSSLSRTSGGGFPSARKDILQQGLATDL